MTTATTTTTSTATNATKSVRFHETVSVRRTLHLNNYTDDEIISSWFTKKEYKQIKREINVTVSLMEKQSKFDEGINFSSRGLEYKTQDQLLRRFQHYVGAIDAVLEEQDRQRNECGYIHDSIALSYVYAEFSFMSHMEAFLRAAADETFALRYSSPSSSSDTTTSSKQTRLSSKNTRMEMMMSPKNKVYNNSKTMGLISPPSSSSRKVNLFSNVMTPRI